MLLDDGESADDIAAPSQAKAPEAAPAADAATKAAPEGSSAVAAPPSPVKDGGRVFASPLARRIAAEKGLDLAQIAGSGPHGRIVKADVVDAKPGAATAPQAAAAPDTKAAPAKAATAMPSGPSADMVARMYEGRDYDEVALDGMRKTVASRLTEAKQTIPHFYLRREVQLDALMKFRADLNKQLEPRGVKTVGQRFHHQGQRHGAASRAGLQRGLGGRPYLAAEKPL